MGYSITEEKYRKLEDNRKAGRLCAMSTGRGGCFTTATCVETHDSLLYEVGEGEMSVTEMTFCGRHKMGVGYVGRNFRVVASKRLPRLVKV